MKKLQIYNTNRIIFKKEAMKKKWRLNKLTGTGCF